MSPTGDFLATAHVNYLGLFIWANKTLFSHVTLRSIDPYSEAPLLELPSTESSDGKLPEIEELSMEGEKLNMDYDSPLQLDSDLVTMSTVALSKWQNLLDLDLVKKRNKPKAPPKTPKQAPFFLPTIAGLDLKFDVPGEVNDGTTKLLIPDNFHNLTIFGKKLEASIDSGNYQDSVDHLMNLGPSMIDFEVKSIHPDGGGSIAVMLQFMKMVEFMFNTNVNFELAQTFLGIFLKSHGRTVAETSELKAELNELQAAQLRGWSTLEDKLLYGLGVVASLRNFSN